MITISYAAYLNGSGAAAEPEHLLSPSDAQLTGQPLAATVGSVQASKVEQDQVLLQDLVPNVAEPSGIATPSFIGAVATVINTVSTITSSDSFSNVMACLRRFVQIGDVLAEVRGSTCRMVIRTSV